MCQHVALISVGAKVQPTEQGDLLTRLLNHRGMPELINSRFGSDVLRHFIEIAPAEAHRHVVGIEKMVLAMKPEGALNLRFRAVSGLHKGLVRLDDKEITAQRERMRSHLRSYQSISDKILWSQKHCIGDC